MTRFKIGDWVRHKPSGLVGQLHHWVRGGASVRLKEPCNMMKDVKDDIPVCMTVSHVVMNDGSNQWEKTDQPI